MRARHLIAVVIALLGVAAIVYPSASQWGNQHAQSQANEHLASVVKSYPRPQREELRMRAEDYNARLATGAIPSMDEYAQSLKLPGTDIMARVRIPEIGVDQPVRHTLNESSLQIGLGHVESSSLPIGGPSTHAVIGGHRGLATTEGFTHLPQLQVGGLIYVETLDQVATYRVTRTQVLDPLSASTFPIVPGADILSLVTCTPLGVNTERWVVTAERVPTPETETAGVKSDLPGFPWWAVYACAGVIAITSYAVWEWRRTRKRHVLAA